MHFIQRKILYDLLFAESVRFADLKPYEMDNGQFMFHLKKLIEDGFISKSGSAYKLTKTGKEAANKLNIKDVSMSVQAKITTVLCAIKTTGSEPEILIYKRLKNPFYGLHGFPTQKVIWGENIKDTAIGGLKEETNLEGQAKLIGTFHYSIYSEDNLLIEDKVMFAYKFENPKGQLESNIEGDFFWMKLSQINSANLKYLPEFKTILKALLEKTPTSEIPEIKVKSSDF